MVTEFELRPGDARVFDAWRAQKYRRFLQPMYVPLVLGTTAAMLVAWWALGSYTVIALGVFAAGPSVVLATVAVAFRYLQEYRYRPARGFVDGPHTLHFSGAGVHHVGPLGIERFPWTRLRGVEVGVHYRFIRFDAQGSIIIPVSAIKRFGPTYDEAFLQELAPLIEEGVAGGT